MLTKVELYDMANNWMRTANGNLRDRKWLPAVQNAGHALELMLKLRICTGQNLAGFPADLTEAKTLGQKHLMEHDLEKLLSFTNVASVIKTKHASEWGTCLQWDKNTKYQPMGTQNKKSATALLRDANIILDALRRNDEVTLVEYHATINPYVKLMEVEKQLSQENGPFKLFAVCHRIDSFEQTADVVVCASWVDPQTRAGVQKIEDKILAILGEEERINRISGVIALSETNPIVKAFIQGPLQQEHGFATLHDVKVNDFLVDNYTLITVGH
jgi:hypothetical protein